MKLKIDFLTPCFIYEDDQQGPEFYISSLVGQMRYWWRMTRDWTDIKKLINKEADIFGLGEQGKKPFYMYLDDGEILKLSEAEAIKKNKKEEYNFKTDRAGISYLFYSSMRRKEKFEWIEKNNIFSLNIDFITSNDDIKNQIMLSIFLLGRFGGLGARSRLGAGAIEFSSDEFSELFELTEYDLIEYIHPDNKKNLSSYNYFHHIHNKSPLYESLSNSKKRFNSWKPKKYWESALDDIGKIMMKPFFDKRDNHETNSDYNAFLEEAAKIDIDYKEKKKVNNRLTYPFHITVNRNKENQYYCIMLILLDP